MTYKEDPRRQIQGFRPERIKVTVLDPRYRMIDGILETKHDDI